ncbi:unnamed protein product [Leuciscus chuanchicus]
MELADQLERGVNLTDDLPADEGELQVDVEDVLSLSDGSVTGSLRAGQELAADDISLPLQPSCPVYAELVDVMGRATNRLQLQWRRVREEPVRGVLDDRFLPTRRPPARTSLPFLPDLHSEIEKAWKNPFSARLHLQQRASFAAVEGAAEHGYVSMPPVDETLANYLASGRPSSLGAPTLPSKPLKTTSRLNGRAYTAAGQAGAVLHTLAVLQAYQADLLRDLDQGAGLPPDAMAELRRTTDLALRATKQSAVSVGRAMAAMVTTERHLWLNQADIGEKEKTFLLDSPVSPSELFGPSVETVVDKFREARARSAAFKSFIPRRSSAQPRQAGEPGPSWSEDHRQTQRASVASRAPPPPNKGSRARRRRNSRRRQDLREVIQSYRPHPAFLVMSSHVLGIRLQALLGLPEYELPLMVVARLQASPGLPEYELPHTVVARLQASPGLPECELLHKVVIRLQASSGLPECELPHTVVAGLPSYELPHVRLQASSGLPECELPHTVVARLQASSGLPECELPFTVVTRASLGLSEGSPTFCGCQVTGLSGLPEYKLPLTVVTRFLGLTGLPEYELPHTVVARLRFCDMTDEGCSDVTSALKSNPSHLRELNLSGNKLGDSGVKNISDLLMNPQFKLEKLQLSDCSVTEEGYKVLASALRSNPSHLIELDLTGNYPGQSGVKKLNDLLQDPDCQLKTLRFLSPAAEEACQYVNRVVGKNPFLQKELNLSEHELGYTRVNRIAALLQDKHCQLNTLTLYRCSITEKQSLILTSALKSNPSHLRELDLSENKLGNTGVKHLCAVLKDSHCKLESLRLRCCNMTDEGCSDVTSALKSNPTHLRELNLSGNKLGDSGVKNLSDLLMNPQFKLVKLQLSDCSVTEEGYKALASALRSNPSHLIELDLTGNYPGQSGMKELNDLLQDPDCQLKTLRFLSPAAEEACQYVNRVVGKNPFPQQELNLSEHELGDTRVNQIAALLQDKHCQLNTLILNRCSITEKQSLILTSALKSNPSHLRELNLSWNKLGNSGVKNLSDLLMNPQFKLEKLHLSDCSITEKQSLILTSALKSNPSHLRELNLSWNKLGDSGVKNLSDLLMNPQFKLEKLHLSDCSITEKQSLILTSALKSNPSHLRELDLSRNKLGNTGVKHLCDVLKDSHCKLERLRLFDCGITDVSSLTQSLTNSKALQFLKELDLRGNKIGDSKQRLRDVIRDSNCVLR